MTRNELESLDRDSLIVRAETAGVTRARILTRSELVDELLIRSAVDSGARQRARGLFGRARDLLARVVEQGLHLPDAADRIRTVGLVSPRPPNPSALPTVTLAEIYAAQGHRDRALDTLEKVLAQEPEHAAAQTLVAQLREADYPVHTPRLPPERDEDADARAPLLAAEFEDAVRGLEDSEQSAAIPREWDTPIPAHPSIAADASISGPTAGQLSRSVANTSPPASRSVAATAVPVSRSVANTVALTRDSCIAIPIDANTVHVSWEIGHPTLAHARSKHPNATLALRALVVVPNWDAPQSSLRDCPIDPTAVDFVLRDLPAPAIVRVAIGFRDNGTFIPLAHSPELEPHPDAPRPLSTAALLRWTSQGRVPIAPADRDAPTISRACQLASRLS